MLILFYNVLADVLSSCASSTGVNENLVKSLLYSGLNAGKAGKNAMNLSTFIWTSPILIL